MLSIANSYRRTAIEFSSQIDEATYGIDYEGPTPSEEWHGPLLANENNPVEVPPTGCPLNDSDWQELNTNFDPTRESVCHGVDIYLEVLEYVEGRIHNNAL